MIHLMTQMYPIRDDLRLWEIRTAIEKNLSNDQISHLYLFLDSFSDEQKKLERFSFIHNPKITIIDVNSRPTYKTFFDYAEANLAHKWCAVSNSDCFFDDSVRKFHGVHFINRLACITRYNIGHHDDDLTIQGDGGSHDAWVFVPPIKPFHNDILMGVLGCDSYLAQKALEAGIDVFNPCLDVKLRHLHRIGERNDAPGGKRYWDEPDYKGTLVRFGHMQ